MSQTGVDDEEVAGQHLVSVLADEGLRGALAATWNGLEAVAGEDPEHGEMRAAHSELDRVLLREPNGRLTERLTVGGLPAPRPRSIGGPASADQLPMPSQQRLGAGQR